MALKDVLSHYQFKSLETICFVEGTKGRHAKTREVVETFEEDWLLSPERGCPSKPPKAFYVRRGFNNEGVALQTSPFTYRCAS